MKHSNRALLIPVILFALLMQGCSGHAALNDPVKRSGFYFDTLVTITVYGNEAESYADDCLSMCSYYEGLLSMTVDGSDISRINNAGTESVTVSGETIELLEYAMDCYDSTQGALDISVAPASGLWTDARKSNELPSDDSLSDAVSHIGLDKLHVYTESLSVSKDDPGLSIDVGALGKGFVADKIKDMLVSKGVKSAVISLGGNILTIGSKPDGNPFKIGIKEPFSDSGKIAASLNVSGMSVVTSGIYERYFMHDGKIYHHIIDTETGRPKDTDLTSATIISPSSLDGDALSTECLLLGLNDAVKLIENTPDTEAVFITADNTLHYTGGVEKYLIK